MAWIEKGTVKVNEKTGKERVLSWRVRWYYEGRRDGQRCVTTVDLEDDAIDMKRAIEKLHHRVLHTDPDVINRTIITGKRTQTRRRGGPLWPAVAEEWLASRGDSISHGSRRKYEIVIQGHFDAWQTTPVADISSDIVRAWAHARDRAGQKDSVPLIVALMVLRFAAKRGYVTDTSAAEGLELSKRKKARAAKVRRTIAESLLSQKELDLLQAEAYNCRQPEFGLYVKIAIETGMRLSEIAALRGCDILPHPSVIAVSQTVKQGEKPNTWEVGRTKSADGERIIPVTDELMTEIEAHCAAFGIGPDDYLFVHRRIGAKHHGEHLNGTTVGNWWRAAVTRAQRKGMARGLKFHGLRHMYATMVAGSPVRGFLPDLLGHADAETSRVYTHLADEMQQALRETLTNRRAATATTDDEEAA